jgi:hypothetical protein
MTRATWEELKEGLSPDDLAKLEAFRDRGLALGDVEMRVNRTDVSFARKRVFASAYVKSHWLEVGIELLRRAEHPRLRTAFPTTKKVTMHRLTFGSVDELDDAFDELLREAWKTVRPGTR